MRSKTIVALLTCTLALTTTPAIAQEDAGSGDTATVILVHGFRGLLADVYLDGDPILEGFAPERSTDPTPLPAGTHTVEVREADAPADSEPVLAGDIDLEPGSNVSAVVHADTDGAPTMSVFDNDVPAPGDGEARTVVRHTANGPAVDVTVGDVDVADGLQPGGEQDGVIDPGADEITTREAGTSRELVAPARINAEQDATVAIYLIGSTEDDSLGWLSQRLDGAQTPAVVPTGNSGLRTSSAAPWWAAAAGLLALFLAARVAFTGRRATRALT